MFLVDFYLTLFGIIQFTALIISLLPGFLLDWSPAGRHRSFSLILSFLITGSLSILLTVGVLIPVLELQVNFIMYSHLAFLDQELVPKRC